LGFLSSLGIILWLPIISLGTFTVTVYSAFLGYSYLGPGIFVLINFALAVYWNKARKHARAGAFLDDRLSSEKMDNAREWWMNKNNEDDS
jgi:hypothetical protein